MTATISHLGDPHACRIRTRSGRAIRTDSYDQRSGGASYVAVEDEHGEEIAVWVSSEWANPATAKTTMVAILRAAGADLSGDEQVLLLLGGARVQGSADGSDVRLVGADGREVDGGSAYWVYDEWVEDPELVMGAILGGAKSLTHLARIPAGSCVCGPDECRSVGSPGCHFGAVTDD